MRRPAMPKKTITIRQHREAYRLYALTVRRACRILNHQYKHLDHFMDPGVANNVSRATYDDIERYKDFHQRNRVPGEVEKRSDVVKRAAYFTKWMVKLRPVMIRRIGPYRATKDIALLVNESIAIQFAMILIGGELEKTVRLTEKAYADFLYDLHYRSLNEDALLTFYQIVINLARAGRANELVEISYAQRS